MSENSGFGDTITNGLDNLENEIMNAQDILSNFVKGYMQEYRNMAFETQVQISDMITAHGTAMIDQENKRREAVAESAETEKERNETVKTAIGLEEDLIEVRKDAIETEGELQDARKLSSEDLKQIGNATLDAYSSISSSILEIKRNEAEAKKALIDKELEQTLGALEKEKQERLIAAGFAVENNAQSLDAQLEAARSSGDEALAYELERRIQEKEINDEFDKLAEEANREAAEKKAKLEYDIAKQEHAQKIIDAVTASALAILNSLKAGGIVGGILAAITGAAAAVQIAAITSNPPKMPSFSTGGIVPGSNFTGDKVLTSLNSREGVFTLADQQYLFDQIQNQKLAGNGVKATIVISLDSREIAKSTIDLVNDGFYTIKARALR